MTRTASVLAAFSIPRALALVLSLVNLASCSAIEDLFGLDDDDDDSSPFQLQSTREGVASDPVILIRDRWLVFLASEATSGVQGTDFNQDGDFGDSIATVIDMLSDSETVLDVAAQEIAILGDEIYFATDEDADDRDWNLDGFASSLVLLHWSATSNVVSFVATLNADGRSAFATVGNRLYYCQEPSLPLLAPNTTLAFVSSTAPMTPVTIQNADLVNSLRPRLVAADEGLLFVFQDETVEGRDLNGDGDQADEFVLALFDTTVPGERVQSVGLAMEDELSPVRALNTAPNDWLVAFLVNEDAQAGANLNDPALFDPLWQPAQCAGLEDADTNDDVLFFLHFAAWNSFPGLNPPVNTGLAGSERVLAVTGRGASPGFVATITDELDEGTCSLNFDPNDGNDIDQDDSVLRVVEAQIPVLPLTDVREIQALKLDVPGGTFGVAELADRFLSVVDEEADSRDHDGFPDEDFAILAKLDPTQGLQAEWVFDQAVGADELVGPSWMIQTEDRSRLLIAMQEAVMRLPLNSGDNDLGDSVPAFGLADPNNPGDIDFPGPPLAVDPTFGGIALGGQFAFYRVSELDETIDLNHDGDQNDIVLFRTDVDTLLNTVFVDTLMNNVQETDAPVGVTGGSAIGAAYIVNEQTRNLDFNGDDDFDDFVLRWFRF